jgi:hypothetical protein
MPCSEYASAWYRAEQGTERITGERQRSFEQELHVRGLHMVVCLTGTLNSESLTNLPSHLFI